MYYAAEVMTETLFPLPEHAADKAMPGDAPKSTESAAGTRNFSELKDRLQRLVRISEASNVVSALAHGPTGSMTEDERNACFLVINLLEEFSEATADEV